MKMEIPFKTKLYWAQIDFLTKTRIAALRNYFGNLDSAWQKGNKNNFKKAGISEKSIDIFLSRKEALNISELEHLFEKSGADLIFFEDPEYPAKLKEISAPPIFLFTLGKLIPEHNLSFAVVGSRKITRQGKHTISEFVPSLVNADFTIASGLARGVDASAHQCCIDSGGLTIAILGSGIDRIWPRENINLAKRIIDSEGAVISEFPLNTEPFSYNFPRRNRIISGISLGVLIIEGAKKSGSIITAHTALEQNREVFAIPGAPFNKLSEGPNTLIKNGEAKLVLRAEDILEEFGMTLGLKKEPPQFNNEMESQIYKILENESKMFDEIVSESEYLPATVSSTLTIMELKGYIKHLGMGQWTTCR